jgi:5-(carboxyamino)imidazole ribonucleotide mutase
MSSKVAVIMGSDSDFQTVLPAIKKLKDFGIEYTVKIISAHRSPDLATEFAKSASEKGYKVIIAAAGKAAHLAGFLAANTVLPVIGLPIKSSTMDGLDSLLSTVQMPSGIPVATVAINGAENAAILAAEILAVSDEQIAQELVDMKKQMRAAIDSKNEKIVTDLLENSL